MSVVTSLRPLVTSICGVGSRQMASGILQLLMVVVVGRALGPSGLGVFSIALLVPTLMSAFLSFGVGPANTYYLAVGKYNAHQVWKATLLLYFCAVAVCILLGIISVISGLSAYLFPDIPPPILILAVLIFFPSLLVGYIASIFQGLHDFGKVNILTLLPSLVAFSLVMAVWCLGSLTVISATSSVLIGNCAAVVWGLPVLTRRLKQCAPRQQEGAGNYLRAALGYGSLVHAGNLVALCNYKTGLFLVNLILGSSAAGIFALATRLAEQLLLIAQSVTTVLFPKVASLAEFAEARNSLTALMSRTVLGVTLVGGCILMAVAEPLVDLLAGFSFEEASTVMYALIPGVVLLSCSKVLASDTAARGLVHVNLLLAILMLTITVAATFWLTRTVGVVGAGLAATIAYATDLGIRVLLQRRTAEANAADVLIPKFGDFARLIGK